GIAAMNPCHFGDELMEKTRNLRGRFSIPIRRRNAIDTRFTIRFLNFVYSAFHDFFDFSCPRDPREIETRCRPWLLASFPSQNLSHTKGRGPSPTRTRYNVHAY